MSTNASKNLTPIVCAGNAGQCGNELIFTDGERFYIVAGRIAMDVELEPPRIICSKCGYKTRLETRRIQRVLIVQEGFNST